MAAPSPWAAISAPSLRYTVTIAGSPLADGYGVTSITITHKINIISTAELSISGSYPADFSSLPFIDDTTFVPGSTIVITAGYGDSETILFSGLIVSNAISIGGEEPVSLTVSCKHQAAQMTYSKKSCIFTGKKDSEIITSLLSLNGFSSATVTATDAVTTDKQFLQNNTTDWDIIRVRAEANGLLIFMDGDDIQVIKPAFTASPVLTVAAGISLLDFKAELNAEKQVGSVVAYSWDSTTGTLLSATSAEPSLNSQGFTSFTTLLGELTQTKDLYNFSTPMTTTDLQTFADSRLLRVRMKALRGSFSLVGSALAKTGCLITLEGVGAMYNGDAYISSVTHSISNGLWKTSVEFGLDDEAVSTQPGFDESPVKTQVPPIEGLQTATIEKLSGDETSTYRMKINRNDSAPSDTTEIWARYSNFYATNGAGLGFMPEVGDEVVVGYLGNDPAHPIILGSLYGKKNVAANPAQDENNYIKSLTTKEKLTLSFDDQNKIIIIKTPGNNKITISDQDKSIELLDQNENSVKLSTDGIVLTSKKAITLTADGDVSITAKGELSLTSTKDMSATSEMNITHEAKLGFTGKGSGTAEVSATGSTTIKGGTVMIN